MPGQTGSTLPLRDELGDAGGLLGRGNPPQAFLMRGQETEPSIIEMWTAPFDRDKLISVTWGYSSAKSPV